MFDLQKHLTRKLAVQVHPYDPVKKQIVESGSGFAIEKEEGGKTGRYLCGVVSGVDMDAHGDRMSKEAIQDFVKQFEEKDITLYVNHNREYTRDIANMSKSEILSNGDWYCEFKMYEEEDGVPDIDLQEVNKVWKMANALHPYKKSRQFGFSIEGLIEEKDIEKTADGRIIKKVDLDPGVSLVTKPAYQSSMATAVAKALNVVNKSIIDEYIGKKDSDFDAMDEKWAIESAKDDLISQILQTDQGNGQDKEAMLSDLLDDYKSKMLAHFARIGYSIPDEHSEVIESNAPALVKSIQESKDVLNKTLTVLGKIKNL